MTQLISHYWRGFGRTLKQTNKGGQLVAEWLKDNTNDNTNDIEFDDVTNMLDNL